jgi:glycerophosphoryl diester phosphodiesterase
MTKPYPLIIAHRGASGSAPENTLAAFQLAVDQQADGVELDVQLTRDNRFVVCHDRTVNRTTNGRGKIRKMRADDICRLDAGSYFDNQFTGQRVPLLEEVLAILPQDMLINIEIKHIPPYDIQIEERFIDVLTANRRLDHVIISSFDHQLLARMKKIHNDLNIGLIYKANLLHPRQYAQLSETAVYSLHPHLHAIQAEDVAEARRHGLHIFAWTVNTAKQAQRCIDLNVTGVITDHPSEVRKHFTEVLK